MQISATPNGRKLRVNKTEQKLLSTAATLVKEIAHQTMDSGLADLADELVTLSKRFCAPPPAPETTALFDKEETVPAGAGEQQGPF